jgi:hypothetical protein
MKNSHSAEDSAAHDSTTLEVRCLKHSSRPWSQELSDSSPFASLLSAVAMVTSSDDCASHARVQLKQSSMSLNPTVEAYSEVSIFDRSVGSDHNSEVHPTQRPIFNSLNSDKDSCSTDGGIFLSGMNPITFYTASFGFVPMRSGQSQRSYSALRPTSSGRSPFSTKEKHAKMPCPAPPVHHERGHLHSVLKPSGKKASCQLTKPATTSAVVAVQVDATRPPENPFLKQPTCRQSTVCHDKNIMATKQCKPVKVVTVSSTRAGIEMPVQWSVSCQTPMAWLPKPTSAACIFSDVDTSVFSRVNAN